MDVISKNSVGLFFIILGFYAIVFGSPRLKAWFSIVLGIGLIYVGFVFSR